MSEASEEASKHGGYAARRCAKRHPPAHIRGEPSERPSKAKGHRQGWRGYGACLATRLLRPTPGAPKPGLQTEASPDGALLKSGDQLVGETLRAPDAELRSGKSNAHARSPAEQAAFA